MGIPDYTLVDLIKKVRSWISWGSSDSNSMAFGFKITENDYNCFCHCGLNTSNSCIKYRCFSCERWLCEKCVKSLPSSGVDYHSCLKEKTEAIFSIEACELCIELGPVGKTAQRCSSGKVHPCESPRKSLDQSSPSFSGEKFDGHFPCSVAGIADELSSNHSSPVKVHHSSSSCDEDEVEDFNASSEYLNEISDVDSVCARARHEFCNSISIGSSPSNSPSRINITSNRVGHCVQRELELNSDSRDDGSFNPEQAILEKPAGGIWDSGNEKLPEPFNFENNGLIWIPPPPDDAAHGEESSFFMYDDEDDEVGESGAMFISNTSFDSTSLGKDKKLLDSSKEPLRAAVEGHFRALVLQLLQGQGIISTDENSAEDWLNIIAAISWQTANYIKPDTKRGGSMDPCDYVKVKCVASGNPSQSKLVKGIVCTKNIKHKRMTSQYRNTRLLLLGGALEYQRVPDQLASLDTLLQQENDHLKMVISKIEALRPNVLLVEKSVSSFAQDQLLAKEISLVLNVKRPLLERIARCTGAFVTPSIDYIHKTRLGHCELFHLEKIVEDREPVNQFNKRPSKTLMFFEGCPRRLGCTVVLRGSSLEELKKVKNVVQYAIFAAYHLLLEASFLADEGAILPKSPQFTLEKTILSNEKEEFDLLQHVKSVDLNLEQGLRESLSELEAVDSDDDFIYRKALMDACDEVLALDGTLGSPICSQVESPSQVEGQSVDDADVSGEYFSANESSQSILVSFASHCILSGSVCERRLLRVKFYGPSDKPLGRYLREDLFDETCHCNSCKESAEAHSICYTHQHGNLMINVRRLSSIRLPGEEDGKIWMWHRCLKCTHIEGIPPSTRRVVMSDSAWGLSFGKFLELSFSKYATGNRVASCGHSLQRDCLRFYGFGSRVAFFRYSPISILSVRLPPPFLEFCRPGEQHWIREEASELLSKAEALYAEIAALLQDINQRSLSSTLEFSDASDLHGRVLELSDMVAKEQNYYQDLLQPPNKAIQDQDQAEIDILEINRLRHSLIISSDVWDRRLYLLDSLLRRSSCLKIPNIVEAPNTQEGSGTFEDAKTEHPTLEECAALFSNNEEPLCMQKRRDEALDYEEDATSLERHPSAGSILSDKIDSAWSGADMAVMGARISALEMNQKESPAFRRLLSPTRVYSFDSAQRLQERMSKELPPHLHLSTIRSFHASGDFKFMLRDPVSRNVQRTYSQALPSEAEKFEVSPSFIQFLNILPEGARLLIPQQDVVITVYDNEPTSMISYALISKEYINWISNKQTNGHEREVSATALINNSYSSLDFDCMHYGNYTSEDTSIAGASLFADPKTSPHLRISFEDESPAMSEKMKFDVTCYFAREFDALRKRCCPNEMDFICSLSRCRRWRAQGGKSNVHFAKSFDERFIIKEVTKTELESFNEVSSEYFKYLTNAINSGSPTCLAKILGIYQIAVKPSKGGKEKKMDLMVMENLFFKRTVSKVYDLKGSARSRYNPDTTGANKVMLDMNLLETLRTNPIFLGSQAKRKLERAVWNDTSFLARVDVMDYSLLVGVDEERNELVLGIIDYLRQYTWDKHLETWVKASGILGGAKNASPTIVSPKQYKKRFRKAMTAYFLTVPGHWSS